MNKRDSFPSTSSSTINEVMDQTPPESFLSELRRIKRRRDTLSCVRSSTPPPPSNITPFFPRFALPGGGSPPLLNSQISESSDDAGRQETGRSIFI